MMLPEYVFELPDELLSGRRTRSVINNFYLADVNTDRKLIMAYVRNKY